MCFRTSFPRPKRFPLLPNILEFAVKVIIIGLPIVFESILGRMLQKQRVEDPVCFRATTSHVFYLIIFGTNQHPINPVDHGEPCQDGKQSVTGWFWPTGNRVFTRECDPHHSSSRERRQGRQQVLGVQNNYQGRKHHEVSKEQ